MKFITEDELRDLFKMEPFTTYELEENTRLTPGARQFLIDRGINMFDDIPKKCSIGQNAKSKNLDLKNKKLLSRLKSLEAKFLLLGRELLDSEVLLAQSVITLEKQLVNIRNFIEGKCNDEINCLTTCCGMCLEDLSKDIDDCFLITEFHINLTKGKEILKLHQLRCDLREIEICLLEIYYSCESKKEEIKLWGKALEKINCLINALSQIICSEVGGKECQRKI